MYEKLKLHRVCSKGRGAIALLYGPPGVGKTMTAEVVAEMMGRSLIKLSLCATDSEELVRRLSVGFQRAKRYRSVLLLDEVDVFIRKRGGTGGVSFDENTSVFLRMMEYYDGVLLMTTNLPDQIDPAVFSRVHICLEYKAPEARERKAIWNGMLPTELKAAILGTPDEHEEMLQELSEIPINGREIKTVIQNAVGEALTSLTEQGTVVQLPAIQWIRRESFVEEARLLHSQRETLSS
jgi:SpoVK/Ycf46/Vps4 family AAA+-type ATPase